MNTASGKKKINIMTPEKKQLNLQMRDIYYNPLISEEHTFDAESLSAFIEEACEFAYRHFKDEETFYEDDLFEYENRIYTVGLRLMIGLKKYYPHLKKEPLLIETIYKVLSNENYRNGRGSFILVLWENLLDDAFLYIAEPSLTCLGCNRGHTQLGIVGLKELQTCRGHSRYLIPFHWVAHSWL